MLEVFKLKEKAINNSNIFNIESSILPEECIIFKMDEINITHNIRKAIKNRKQEQTIKKVLMGNRNSHLTRFTELNLTDWSMTFKI